MDLSKELVIRREQPADYATVEQVVREAFWNVYTPACTEHYLLHIMRDHPAFVPELDMLALVGEKIAGSVVYMRSFILACNGIRYETLTLGPIAVLPEYQRQGVGRSLISQSRELARRMGFRAILLCGDDKQALAEAVWGFPGHFVMRGPRLLSWARFRAGGNLWNLQFGGLVYGGFARL